MKIKENENKEMCFFGGSENRFNINLGVLSAEGKLIYDISRKDINIFELQELVKNISKISDLVIDDEDETGAVYGDD